MDCCLDHASRIKECTSTIYYYSTVRKNMMLDGNVSIRLRLADDSTKFQRLIDKGYDFIEDARMWPVHAAEVVERKREKLEVFKEKLLADAQAGGAPGMAHFSGIVKSLLERLENLKISAAFKDLSDDDKAAAISTYKAAFENAWSRHFSKYRRDAQDATKDRDWFWQ